MCLISQPRTARILRTVIFIFVNLFIFKSWYEYHFDEGRESFAHHHESSEIIIMRSKRSIDSKVISAVVESGFFTKKSTVIESTPELLKHLSAGGVNLLIYEDYGLFSSMDTLSLVKVKHICKRFNVGVIGFLGSGFSNVSIYY